MAKLDTVCHRDGTITYWSVFQQVWVSRAETLPVSEYLAMSFAERQRVVAHLRRFGKWR